MVEDKKEFVFTWKIENFPYCSQKYGEELCSPTFLLCDKSKWQLYLFPRGDNENSKNYISCYLCREDKSSKGISLGFTLELLNDNGVTLRSKTVDQHLYSKSGDKGFEKFELIKNIHDCRRSEFLPNDTLTLRCRIWKTVGSFPTATQCLGRTHVGIMTLAFLWCINDLNASPSTSKKILRVPTASNPNRKLSFTLIKEGCTFSEEIIGIRIAINHLDMPQFLFCEFDLMDRCKKKVINSRKEIWIDPEDEEETWKVIPFVSKKMFARKRDLLLPKDTLNIQCRIIISSGDEMSVVEYDHDIEMQNQQNELNIHSNKRVKREVETSVPNDLKHDLLQMYQEGTLSDVTLETETETFQALKALLCARSPVFHKMFSVDMKEKTSKNVRIDDLDADTVRQFLMYIYNDSVGNLDLESAKKLYFAGDKYQVFSLRKKCADFILQELSKDNVYEILLLADRHRDEPFKKSVIDFILDHCEEILELDEWKCFMKNNGQVAAEVMYQIYLAS